MHGLLFKNGYKFSGGIGPVLQCICIYELLMPVKNERVLMTQVVINHTVSNLKGLFLKPL